MTLLTSYLPKWNSFNPIWDTSGMIMFVIFIICGILSFALSYNCYDDTDDTPIGLRIIFAILAALWNVAYIVYYLFTVYVMDMKCRSRRSRR
jgi:hypothetical protein